MRMGILLLCVMATGCAGIPDAPREVLVPVSTPCLSQDSLPKPPAFVTDAQLAAMTDGDLILSLAADRRQNQGYRAELEAVIQGCVK